MKRHPIVLSVLVLLVPLIITAQTADAAFAEVDAVWQRVRAGVIGGFVGGGIGLVGGALATALSRPDKLDALPGEPQQTYVAAGVAAGAVVGAVAAFVFPGQGQELGRADGRLVLPVGPHASQSEDALVLDLQLLSVRF